MGAVIFPAAASESTNANADSPSATVDALYQKLEFLQNAHGAVPSAFDAWLAMRGAKTLAVRMREHGRNAVKLARALRRSRHVSAVIYPGLREHPGHAVAREVLSAHARKFVEEWERGDVEAGSAGSDDFPFGGMVSFRIAGGEGAAELPEKMTHGVRFLDF
jgi:cystathionine gamma-lyase